MELCTCTNEGANHKGFLLDITPHAAVRENQAVTQRGHPHLAILSIFILQIWKVINQGYVCDPIVVPSHHFLPVRLSRPPGEGAEHGALHLQPAALLHSQPAEMEAASLQIHSLQRKRTQHKCSQGVSQVHCKKEMSWHCDLHNTYSAFAEQKCREDLTTLPVLWQVPTLGVLIPSLMCAFSFRGIKKKAMWDFCLRQSKNGKAASKEHGQWQETPAERCFEQFYIYHN